MILPQKFNFDSNFNFNIMELFCIKMKRFAGEVIKPFQGSIVKN